MAMACIASVSIVLSLTWTTKFPARRTIGTEGGIASRAR